MAGAHLRQRVERAAYATTANFQYVGIYGDVQAFSKADEECWSSANSTHVLSEADLGSADFAGYIGTWNLPLLRWLRAVSQATGEEVRIDYEHERGDYPYEFAWWRSSPVTADGRVEVFGIQSHDGMTDPEWRREVIRYDDGRVEVRGDEWPGTGPRDA